MTRITRALIATAVCLAAAPSWGQQSFSELVGPVAVKAVKESPELEVPFLTWGGDVATFLANGGLATKSGSLYEKHGLKIKLTKGDDFVAQVKNYLSGKTPFLRGTVHMLGQASEVLGGDPRTKPVIVLQLSWSAGDHVVSRENLRTLNDLKGKDKKIRIACQQGGPHVGLLYDSLAAAQLNKEDIEVVWVADLTGEKGPAEAFRKDPSIDACCVITPDMIGLTGGIDQAGSGAEGTVKGAHVLNSTQQMSRSIADVYAIRSDWFKAHRQDVAKFVAGYLKATEDLLAMRKQFEDGKKMLASYKSLLSMAQQIFGKDVLPTIEVDAHGLLLDCAFVGLPGQIAFFEDKGNLSGFQPKMKEALDLAVGWGYASTRRGFDPPGWDYEQLANLAGVKYVRPEGTERFAGEGVDVFPGDESLDENTIVSFTINFQPEQSDFSVDQYGAEFHRAVQSASTFGNAVVVIRGHADPTKTLVDLIKAGMAKGIIKRTGQKGNYRYFLNGQPLDLSQTGTIVGLIGAGAFNGTKPDPSGTMQSALNLSLARAKAVKDAVVKYAKDQGLNLDLSQMQPVGAGITEPLIPKPENPQEALENMRVEFRIVRVAAEAVSESDFDF